MMPDENPTGSELFDEGDWEQIERLKDELLVSYLGVNHRITVNMDAGGFLHFFATPLHDDPRVKVIDIALLDGQPCGHIEPKIGDQLDISYVKAFIHGFQEFIEAS